MKIKIIVISVLLVIAIIIGTILLLGREDKKEITELEYLYFSYSNGYAMNSNIYYHLEKKDNNYVATIKPYEVPEEDKLVINIDTNFVDKVLKILNKYNVASWDGFAKYDKDVLDGDSFTMHIKCINGDYISANGYMEYPENYREVENELDNIFMELYNSKTRGSL